MPRGVAVLDSLIWLGYPAVARRVEACELAVEASRPDCSIFAFDVILIHDGGPSRVRSLRAFASLMKKNVEVRGLLRGC